MINLSIVCSTHSAWLSNSTILVKIFKMFYFSQILIFLLDSDDSSSLKQLSDVIASLYAQQVADDQTKVWIISALSKIVSCAEFGGNPEVDDVLQDCLNSTNQELRQRAYEYSRVPKGITNLAKNEDFDFELSFLEPVIEKSIKMGLGKYDKSKANTMFRRMKRREKEENAARKAFITKHEKVDIKKQKELGKKEKENAKGPVGLKGKKTDWIKKQDGKPGSGQKSKAKPVQVFKKQTKDPKKNAKTSRIAKGLFGDMNQSLKKPGKGGKKGSKMVFKPPKGAASKKKPKSGGGSNPFSSKKKAEPAVNNSAANDNLLGDLAPNQPAGGSNQNLIGGGNDEVNLLEGSPSKQSPSPQNKSFSFSPLVIEQPEFEVKWPELECEETEDIKTKKVTTKMAFKKMTEALGFHIVSAIDNNNICASQYGDQVVLMFGKYTLGGTMECRVKANTVNICKSVLTMIKQYSQ